ncbi:MFS transporter [Lactobacillus sp.] [Lactiplantibacillus mudanjiangensis]|nr:MFS transporter [Lactobacillus sp.] [Lactiplantibacillus mudanjiangensis]
MILFVLFFFFLFDFFFFFFQAEDGIRDSSTSRGLGDVYKRQVLLGRLVQSLGIGITFPTIQTVLLVIYPPEKLLTIL